MDINYALHSAATADRVLVVVPFRDGIAPILEDWTRRLTEEGSRELSYGARVYRANGVERVTFPNGGRVDFASPRTLDARTRGRDYDVVCFVGATVTAEQLRIIEPSLALSLRSRVLDQNGPVRPAGNWPWCGADMHKACQCRRPQGHLGAHNCIGF